MAEPDKIVYTYVDNSNKRATSEHFVETGLTLDQMAEGTEALAEIIDAVTNSRISAANAVYPVDISGLTGNATPAVGADVEEVGEFISHTAAGRPVIVNLPGIAADATGVGTDDLDTSLAPVAALISMLEDGIAVTGGTIIPCDAGEDDILQVDTARERVRNSGSRV